MNIFWFRRDLRLTDNTGLFNSLKSGDVTPIFIFDSNILAELPKDDARVTFIHVQLSKINDSLKSIGKSLAIFSGEPEAVFTKLIAENEISNVFANEDYEPYAIARDNRIAELLQKNGTQFNCFKDHVTFAKDEILKSDGKPYVVFTPYSNRWKEKAKDLIVQNLDGSDLFKNFATHSYPFLSMDDIGFETSEIKVPEFNVTDDLIRDYEKTRNFPAMAQTSALSPHLRFGTISIREILKTAIHNEIFLNELIWREFFIQILWHFPNTVNKSFRPKYDRIRWRNNEDEFKKWCEGNTGYPIVDAGMRQLNATGLMHNRVRMVTASFLCKHLLIDWRWGEAYFALKLLDYEQASNVGNWQWAAGSGVDAAPYFRIFNPTEQVKKFDKDLKYIKKWIPELESFDYPEPIVDHKEARERCLRVYREGIDEI